jgi:imidazolonepropionase-like amidohydrolase
MREHHLQSFRRAMRAGVRIAMGTDDGNYGYGDTALELELLVEAGMTPAQAIETGTRRAAECLGLERQVGTLEAGKAADLIVLDADPLGDIKVLREAKHRALVMKGGVPVAGPLRASFAPAGPGGPR